MNKCIFLIFILLGPFFQNTVLADSMSFMVLNMKGKKESTQQWKPLVQYLETRLSQKISFVLMLNSGLIHRSLGKDIILTNPVSAVILADKGEFEIIATLDHFQQGSFFAGVIVVQKDSNIRELKDLASKEVGVINRTFAAGGFLFQANELLDAGLIPEKDFTNFREMSYQKSIIRRVIKKQLDAGFIRTGMLELFSKTEDISQLRILNRMDEGLNYPRSTAIYPHWAVLVNKRTSDDIKSKIINALLEIKPASEIAKAGKMKGFVSAEDYSPIKKIMARLKVYDFEN